MIFNSLLISKFNHSLITTTTIITAATTTTTIITTPTQITIRGLI